MFYCNLKGRAVEREDMQQITHVHPCNMYIHDIPLKIPQEPELDQAEARSLQLHAGLQAGSRNPSL